MNPADMEAAVETVATRAPIRRLATGSHSLDLLLDGGWTEYQDIEIHGPTMSGKSALVYASVALASRAGPVLLYDDGSYGPHVARRFSINEDNLIITSSLDAAGCLFDDIDTPIELAVFDHLRDKDEAGYAWNLLCPCTTLYVTQEREQLVRRGGRWVSAGVAAGWISEPSVRLRMSKQPGDYYEARVERDDNRSPVTTPARFKLDDSGIDTAQELLDLGLSQRVIFKRSGARYWTAAGEYLGHGDQEARTMINYAPGLAEEILAEVVARSQPRC